jgi:transcriptional regulator with XRE-family HTH domain/tetratricopeptide (TPR) repeat protein
MPDEASSRHLVEALIFLRERKGWTQFDLAAAARVSRSSIQGVEQGRYQLSTGMLAAILRALEIDYSTIHQLAAVLRKVPPGEPRDGAPEDVGADDAGSVAAGASPDLQGLVRSYVAAGSAPPSVLPIDESRRRAPELWTRLLRYPEAVQEVLVREAAELHDVGFCELLCDQSIEVAGDSAQRALRQAELAVLAAERLPGEEGLCRRVEGYCRMHVVNALKVGGTIQAATAAFSPAAAAWDAGAGADAGALNEARVVHIEASLRREQRDLLQALKLFDRALAIDRWGETPALLIGKSYVLYELGEIRAAIAMLRQAAPLLDGGALRKLFAVNLNLGIYLCDLGEHRSAELGLSNVRELARRLGNDLDSLRVTWLEARVAAGLGRTSEALSTLYRLREEFEQRGIVYDVALVTVELAELHASLGQTAEVKALVRASAPIFEAEGVPREAQRALALFRRAAEQDQANLALIRGLLAYLERARRDPQLRYQEPG